MTTVLSNRMRLLAAREPDHAVLLKEKADALDEAVNKGETRGIIGAWARARRAYCDVTGEDLV